MKFKKWTAFVAISVVLIVAAVSYAYSIASTGFDIDADVYLYIDKDDTYAAVLRKVEQEAKVKDLSAFTIVADLLKYKNVKTGRYKVTPDMNVRDLVRALRAGLQTPLKLTFNNVRTLDDLSTRIDDQLMFSKADLDMLLKDPQVVGKYGFDTMSVAAMFIPNTYEVYWDIKPESFLDKMNKEFKAFWSDARLQKAKKQDLTPMQVTILASIVEEECTFVDEYPVVAGLYLNRLHRGQLLQADPTVKFAVGDFALRRVLNVHLKTDSPYNTYMYKGLPPGPIRIPSIQGLEAVLNKADHKYLYMCAKEDFSGRHNFAVTHGEHQRNADKYRTELNRLRIYQ